MLKAYVCVWSNKSAAEMVKFYKSVFKGTKVDKFAYWGKNPMGVKEGSVLTAHLTILGQKIMLLDGQVEMPFNESMSFVVPCKTQKEIDTYWKKLSSGGGKEVECGWVIDKFGVRWQIVPAVFDKWNTTKNKKKKEAMMQAMWQMKKLDIKKLKAAFDNA
jgi:predicted 3-demethylubiquinone-9 3-methyltransferase (glyoxalase superfamily)